MRTYRFTRVGTVTLMAGGILLSSSSLRADLINSVVLVDTATRFQGEVDDNVLTFGNVIFGSANWEVTVTQDDFEFLGLGLEDDIRVRARHLVAPHAGDVAPNPNVLELFIYDVVPGMPLVNAAPITALHPAPHWDRLWAQYVPLPGFPAGKSQVKVWVEHIPEPASTTLGLVGLGMALLFPVRRSAPA